jgi:adenylate cyclase class 2
MAENNTETEIKLYTPDHAEIEKRITAAGGLLTAPRVHERNIRYEDAQHTLTGRHIVLRLRQDTRARLTYKEDFADEDQDGLSRYEAEVEVSDFATMDTILRKLGYRSYMIYEKYRTTYMLDDAEIVLDETPLGNFVEIEAEKSAIQRIVRQLDLSDAPRMSGSYGVLFERVKQRLRLPFADMTFENFEGINVSLGVLQV